MDSLPPIIPAATSPAAPTLNATDTKLLKRAQNAARNLRVLAILTTVGAMGFLAGACLGDGIRGFMAVGATIFSLVAAGYWVLAVAARRGNPTAVGVVMVAMVLSICLALIGSGLSAARAHSDVRLPLPGLIIPILVFGALASSRKVLLDLQERQLWDRAFGPAKPSGNLCVIGGVLLATGFLGVNALTYGLDWKVEQERKLEVQHAKAFVDLIQVDEKEFLNAVHGTVGHQGPDKIETALAKFGVLELHFEVLKKEIAGADPLLQILTSYGNALRQWKTGLLLLNEPNADTYRVQQMFKLGDQLRAEACQEFDRRYAPKKPQPGI